ncbi:MAG: hypothetical protein ACOXZM_11660 [Eubacteriales bacterium]|jgi:putative aldouronate transport system substrate-binding protein
MRYFDMFFTEIGDAVEGVCGLSSWLGIRGTDWDITENNQNYYRIVPKDTSGLSEEEYKNKFVWGGGYLGLVVLDLFPINNPTQEMKAYESADNYYPYMLNRLYDSAFKYTEEENAELASLNTDISTYVDTATAQFITGVTPIDDASWNTYLNTLKQMQIDRVLELKQIGYDRWNSSIG